MMLALVYAFLLSSFSLWEKKLFKNSEVKILLFIPFQFVFGTVLIGFKPVKHIFTCSLEGIIMLCLKVQTASLTVF